MKIPLVGESYALRSPAAACQQTLNLIPQFIDDPDEQGKNKGILVGAPGYHLMGDLNALASTSGHVLKGVWSGGGRCFLVTEKAGTSTLWEINLASYVGGNPSTGSVSLQSQNALPNSSADGNPAQMFGDGNQLGIVKNGFFYIDNGSGPLQAQFLISGTCNTATSGGGGTVTWVSGDQFPPIASGSFPFITIDGVNYTVSSGTATSLNINEDPGTQTGASFTSPNGDPVTAVSGAFQDGYFIIQRPVGKTNLSGTATSAGTTINWVSGSFFTDLEPGQHFTFNSTGFTIDTVVSPTQITVTTNAGTVTRQFLATVGVDLGRQFNISLPDDGISWDPLDFATKEAGPDYISTLFANDEQLFILGEETPEVWQNTGNALFPFGRISGTVNKKGCIAPYSPAIMAEKAFYLGREPGGGPVAYRIDGFTPTRISTHAEEAAWSSGIDTPSGAIGLSEVHDGHLMWVITFPGSLGTWVYDETASEQGGTPLWTQRAGWNGSAFTSYLPRFHTFIAEWGPAGMHVVCDATSGKVYEQNLNYLDDNGNSQQWSRILPHLYARGLLQFFGRATLEMDTGSTTSAVTQPSVNRLYSDDRGHTFANSVPALTGGSGVQGAFSQRVFWPSNGASRDRVFQFTGNNNGNSRTALIDLDMEIEVGDA